MSLDEDLDKFFKRLKKHQDIRYLEGVTPATFFRFLNGSVHLGNISELVENTVLNVLQEPGRADFISSFFADLRYRGKGLKTKPFRESLMWSYIRLYHPQHYKVNIYHDAYISNQIKALEEFIELFYSGISSIDFSEINDIYVNDSLSFFPTVRQTQKHIVGQEAFNKALKTIKNTGMDSLYILDKNLMDVLSSSVREGIHQVMQLYQSDKHDAARAVIFYSLDLYRECKKDAGNFEDIFSVSDYQEKRKMLEKKIAFDTVFLYLLLTDFCDKNGFGIFNRKTVESIKPVRPTISYIKSRFNLSSDKVLSLQKIIVIKAILYAVLKRMQAEHNTTYTRLRLFREIDEHYAWLDVNASRRNSDIRDLIDSPTEQNCVRELWATRNPV